MLQWCSIRLRTINDSTLAALNKTKFIMLAEMEDVIWIVAEKLEGTCSQKPREKWKFVAQCVCNWMHRHETSALGEMQTLLLSVSGRLGCAVRKLARINVVNRPSVVCPLAGRAIAASDKERFNGRTVWTRVPWSFH